MNTYQTEFTRICPVNGSDIKYALSISCSDMIEVERIEAAIGSLPVTAFHEELADRLINVIEGTHTITAKHGAVTIITERP